MSGMLYSLSFKRSQMTSKWLCNYLNLNSILTIRVVQIPHRHRKRATDRYPVLHQCRVLAGPKRLPHRTVRPHLGIVTELVDPLLHALRVIVLGRKVHPIQLPPVDERHQPTGVAIDIHPLDGDLNQLVRIGDEVNPTHFHDGGHAQHIHQATVLRGGDDWGRALEEKLTLLGCHVHAVCGRAKTENDTSEKWFRKKIRRFAVNQGPVINRRRESYNVAIWSSGSSRNILIWKQT